MSDHRYKKVAPKLPEQISFVQAVTLHGDDWRRLGLPPSMSVTMHEFTQDRTEAAIMRMCERGEMARVEI